MRSWKEEQLGIIRIEARNTAAGYLDVGIKNPYPPNTAEYRAYENGISDAYKKKVFHNRYTKQSFGILLNNI